MKDTNDVSSPAVNKTVPWREHLYSTILLTVCCLMQILVSVPNGTTGVVVLEFTQQLDLSIALLGSITSCQSGMAYMGAVPAGILINHYGCRPVVFAGSLLVTAGYISSAFVTSFPLLLLTYGLITGLGLSTFQIAPVYAIQMHFDKHRAMAQGVSVAGQALGQFLWSPLAEFLFRFYGWRGAFFIIAGIQLNGCILAMLLPKTMKATDTKENKVNKNHEENIVYVIYVDEVQNVGLKTDLSKIPVSNDQTQKKAKLTCCHDTLHLLRNSRFMAVCCSWILCPFGYLMPYLWLPSLGVKAGASAQAAAFLVSIAAITSGVFRIVSGALADLPKLCDNRSLMMSVSMLVAGISSVTAPYMDTYTLLTVYAVIQGFASGFYCSLVLTAGVDIVGKEHIALANSIILTIIGGTFLAVNPFSGWLEKISGSTDLTMIVCGCITLAGGLLLMTSELNAKFQRNSHTMLNNYAALF